MAFKLVDLMVDLLPERENTRFADSPGCTGASCRAAATKEATNDGERPGRQAELSLLRDQLRRSMASAHH